MGDSWVSPNEVEHIFLSKKFQELCPFFISIGMSYEQFWYGDLTIPKSYLKAYKIKQEREQEMDQWHMWKQGMYIYEALCDVSPVLHAFSKKRHKASTIFRNSLWNGEIQTRSREKRTY